jgi:hypothetical protein
LNLLKKIKPLVFCDLSTLALFDSLKIKETVHVTQTSIWNIKLSSLYLKHSNSTEKKLSFSSQYFYVFLKTSALLLALFFGSPQTQAQKTIVSGVITDNETGEPLPFVNVSFTNSKIGTSTNFDGYYRIETYYATDSIAASFIGYDKQVFKVKKDVEQTINFKLNPTSTQLEEIVISAKKSENPAHVILKRIIANKDANNKEKLDAYEYEVYNKVEFDLNNISEKFQEKKLMKPFKFIFDNLDTLENKPYLPILMTESVSDYYFQKKPKREKEIIKASKISGIEDESVSQFLGDMYQKINIYDNDIIVFNKNFISPISAQGLLFYRYYLTDSAFIGNKWCYQLDFVPKRTEDLAFTGNMWVADTTYAIKELHASMTGDANINFIRTMKVSQYFEEVKPEVWMPVKDRFFIDFNFSDDKMGIFGKKSTTYRNFTVNKRRPDDFYKIGENVIVAKNQAKRSEDFWSMVRPDSLTLTERRVYSMVDTLKKVPQFRTYTDIVEMLVTGYKPIGWFDLGPYATLYSWNPVEGHRFRMGGRTNAKFHDNLQLHGFTAYGTRDDRFKFELGARYFKARNPDLIFGISYRDDVFQLGATETGLSQDNLLGSFFRRNPANQLTRIENFRAYVEKEWFDGFSSSVYFDTKTYSPLGILSYERIINDGELDVLNSVLSTELTLYTRYARREKYVRGQFNKVSLGTRYPVWEVYLSRGIKDLLGGDYNYTRVTLGYSHRVFLSALGYVDYGFQAGQFFGRAPYILMEIHRGNETFWYDDAAFNTMNFFEFVSDRYIKGGFTYRMNGFLFNKVPLFKRLKWREVFSAKAVVGEFDNINQSEMLFTDGLMSLSQGPFVEAAMGVENIFKIVRIDLLRRLTYLDNPNIFTWGVRMKLQFDF